MVYFTWIELTSSMITLITNKEIACTLLTSTRFNPVKLNNTKMKERI